MITIYAAGDSTVSSFQDAWYMPRCGYGETLKGIFDDRVRVVNLAVSGTSSKSFCRHPNYRTLFEKIGAGDVLLIGFGHNDEKRGDVTFTDARGDAETEGSFAHSLYTCYIRPARERGASVLLATPIIRRSDDGIYRNANTHRTADGDYAEAVRILGEQYEIPVLDLTKRTLELTLGIDGGRVEQPKSTGADACSRISFEEENVRYFSSFHAIPDCRTLYMHAWTGSRELCVDNTHTNRFGALVNAWLIAEELKRIQSPLAAFLRNDLENPLEHAMENREEALNPDYQEPVYERPEKPDLFWTPCRDARGNIWYGTVFGDISQEREKWKTHFTLREEPDQSMYLSAGRNGNDGKIMPKSDGIAMYYTRIPAGRSFSLSGIITVDDFGTSTGPVQASAFGCMVRDDMYSNRHNPDIMGDYIAGGVLWTPGFENGASTFARKSGRLAFEGGALQQSIRAEDTIPVRVFSTSDGYGAQVGNQDPVIAGYDFALTAVDEKYVYVGFFAARSISIHVRDICLELDGRPAEGYQGFGEQKIKDRQE